MATWKTCLPMSAEFPDTDYPELKRYSNGRWVLAYDAADDQEAHWTDTVPQGASGTVTAVITYRMFSATTGAVRWQAALEAISDDDTLDTDAAESFDADNSAGETVPGTAGHISQIAITMTNADGIASGDLYRLRVRRDANQTSGTDDAAGDAEILAVELRDAA